VEGDVERLATLPPPEADDRALEVDVIEPEEAHARVRAVVVTRTDTIARSRRSSVRSPRHPRSSVRRSSSVALFVGVSCDGVWARGT
jgi:hypothetical protein